MADARGRREGGKRGEEGLWLYSKVERLFYAGILVIFHMKLYTYLCLSLSLSLNFGFCFSVVSCVSWLYIGDE